jgi:N-acetylglutamate synthase-like GNAT family acetyltransferase
MSAGGYSLRPAEAGDQALVENLVGAVCEEFGAPFDPELCRSAGGEAWVIEMGGALAGFAAIEPDGKNGARLKCLCMASTWRRMGLGSLLVQTAAIHAHEKGWKRLWMLLPAQFAEAENALKALGFAAEEPPAWLAVAQDAAYMAAELVAPEEG